MGKDLVSSDQTTVQIQDNNPGCMWGMLQILDYHRWRVKKVFPHKRRKHATCKQFHNKSCLVSLTHYCLIFWFFYLYMKHCIWLLQYMESTAVVYFLPYKESAKGVHKYNIRECYILLPL